MTVPSANQTARFQAWSHRPHPKAAETWNIYDTQHPYRDRGRSTVQLGTVFDELVATALVETLNTNPDAFTRALVALSEKEPF